MEKKENKGKKKKKKGNAARAYIKLQLTSITLKVYDTTWKIRKASKSKLLKILYLSFCPTILICIIVSFYIEKLLLARTLTIASLRVQNSLVTVSELYIYIYIYILYKSFRLWCSVHKLWNSIWVNEYEYWLLSRSVGLKSEKLLVKIGVWVWTTYMYIVVHVWIGCFAL